MLLVVFYIKHWFKDTEKSSNNFCYIKYITPTTKYKPGLTDLTTRNQPRDKLNMKET